jgi:predicted RNA-binding protein associated with RNAse of E/G family
VAAHPWHDRDAWTGHGVLQLHRPGDPYAVWVFWDGPERRFAGWYVNLQAPFRRTPRALETLDHELDIWIPADGDWQWKDRDLLAASVGTGRFTGEEVATIRADGQRVTADLDAGRRWWSDEWKTWEPDPAWPVPELPGDWETV